MRIANVCFHRNMVERFCDLNDPAKRKDFEIQNNGKCPIKAFMVEAAEMFNDPGLNSELGIVVKGDPSKDDGQDKHLQEWVTEGLTLNTFDQCKSS